MIRFEDALINKKYIGYAFVKKVYAYKGNVIECCTWELKIVIMIDNKEKDYLTFEYTSEKEINDKLNELEKLLCD